MVPAPATERVLAGEDVPMPRFPPKILVVPTTANFVNGLEVPIPTLPLLFSKSVELVIADVDENLVRNPDTPAPLIAPAPLHDPHEGAAPVLPLRHCPVVPLAKETIDPVASDT